jgi:hypothetical protein
VILMMATANWLIVHHSRQRSEAATASQSLLLKTTRLLEETKGAAVVADMAPVTRGRKP